jgi:hypothetical protein
MHADGSAVPRGIQSRVVLVCVVIIGLGHALEEARGHGWTSRTFPNHWEYIYRIADTSVAIAFGTLVCWIIWFWRNGIAVFLAALSLGFLNWGENELKSRAFFGGFLRTIDWWQWAAIDASLAVLVAILLKPIVRKTNGPHGIAVLPLSIADLFVATCASAVLIVATRSIASLPSSPDDPSILFCGWPQTLGACVTGVLIGGIAAATVYLVVARRWQLGLLAYVEAWMLYLGIQQTVSFPRSGMVVQPPRVSDFFFRLDDPLLVVFAIFAIGMITIRVRRQPMRATPSDT